MKVSLLVVAAGVVDESLRGDVRQHPSLCSLSSVNLHRAYFLDLRVHFTKSPFISKAFVERTKPPMTRHIADKPATFKDSVCRRCISMLCHGLYPKIRSRQLHVLVKDKLDLGTSALVLLTFQS